MDKVWKETYRVRAISVAFAVLALAVFKPFGLEAWQWEGYVHLLVIWILGMGVCLLTEAILRFIVRIPRSLERGATYIIRRNLWFQLINTPLVSLMICLYRHFLLSDRVPANQLSWGNFLETLLVFAFISFAIGLYWRYKFRSRYLALELDEIRQLNEKLKIVTPKGVTLTGTTSENVTLNITDLLFIETIGNYVKVCHLHDGEVRTDMLRATSKQMESELHDYPMIVRCHRAFLVNLAQVEQVAVKSGNMQLIVKHSHDCIPVSRSNIAQIKDAIKNI